MLLLVVRSIIFPQLSNPGLCDPIFPLFIVALTESFVRLVEFGLSGANDILSSRLPFLSLPSSIHRLLYASGVLACQENMAYGPADCIEFCVGSY